MKHPYGCGERTGKVIKPDRALYGIKQAERQWSAVICQTLVDEHCMEQCRADPGVYRKIVEGVVELIFVVHGHVDDILVSGTKEAYDELQARELFNGWRGRGYDDSVPVEVTKTAPSGNRNT